MTQQTNPLDGLNRAEQDLAAAGTALDRVREAIRRGLEEDDALAARCTEPLLPTTPSG